MRAAILNRDFAHPADGWYHIEPKGEHPNRQAGVVQVIDEEAGRAIVNRFNADADASRLSHGSEMLIDHEHFKHDADKETRAYGWLNRLQSRADGIYGRIRWSTTGQAAVDGGDYRFFSTEYDPADVALLNSDGKLRRIRPLRLDGLTLTNNPNNKGGRPITNTAAASAPTVLDREEATARRIGALAVQEQCEHGGSLASCYLKVMNREGVNCFGRASAEVLAPAKVIVNRRLVASQIQQWSCRHVLSEAEKTGFAGHGVGLAFVRNRFPTLAKICNVAGVTGEELDAVNDILAELEPKALKMFEQGYAAPEGERHPKDWWDETLQIVNVPGLKEQNPDLDDTDADAVWNELKAVNPTAFYKLVLRFDGEGPFLWDGDQASKLYAMKAGGGAGILRREMAARRKKQ